MSHQRYPSTSEAAKEPHSVSLKVLRLARPSLVFQYPIQSPLSQPDAEDSSSSPSPLTVTNGPPAPGSLAYAPASDQSLETNADPFILSPILSLPASFGSTYVGETFNCTLCANNEVVVSDKGGGNGSLSPTKKIRGVRIDAEMKLPSGGAVHRLETGTSTAGDGDGVGPLNGNTVDLEPGETLQRIVTFHLKEKGTHVLAVTVSYYEATETSGRTRTFRKLYQFACKPALIVRTKVTALPPIPSGSTTTTSSARPSRRWVLEAQLENCGEDMVQLDRVFLNTGVGLVYEDANWDDAADDGGDEEEREAVRRENRRGRAKPVLHPKEIEQICFIVSEDKEGQEAEQEEDGRIILGVMSVGWKGEMGSVGFLSTGTLGTRAVTT